MHVNTSDSDHQLIISSKYGHETFHPVSGSPEWQKRPIEQIPGEPTTKQLEKALEWANMHPEHPQANLLRLKLRSLLIANIPTESPILLEKRIDALSLLHNVGIGKLHGEDPLSVSKVPAADSVLLPNKQLKVRDEQVILPEEERIASLIKESSVAEVTSKFAPGAKIQNVGITHELTNWEMGDFRTYGVDQGKPTDWRKWRERLPSSPQSNILYDILSRVNSRTVNGQEIMNTIFVETFQRFTVDQQLFFISFYCTQPPRTEIQDGRAAYQVTPVEFTIQIKQKGFLDLINWFNEDREHVPEHIWKFLQAIYPNLIGNTRENLEIGILLNKPKKVIIVNTTFKAGVLDENMYHQENPDLIFPPQKPEK